MYLYTRTRLSMYSTTGLKSYTFWNFNRNQTQNDRFWKKGKFYFLKMCGFFAFVSSLKSAPIKGYGQKTMRVLSIFVFAWNSAFLYPDWFFLLKKTLAHFKHWSPLLCTLYNVVIIFKKYTHHPRSQPSDTYRITLTDNRTPLHDKDGGAWTQCTIHPWTFCPFLIFPSCSELVLW